MKNYKDKYYTKKTKLLELETLFDSRYHTIHTITTYPENYKKDFFSELEKKNFEPLISTYGHTGYSCDIIHKNTGHKFTYINGLLNSNRILDYYNDINYSPLNLIPSGKKWIGYFDMYEDLEELKKINIKGPYFTDKYEHPDCRKKIKIYRDDEGPNTHVKLYCDVLHTTSNKLKKTYTTNLFTISKKEHPTKVILNLDQFPEVIDYLATKFLFVKPEDNKLICEYDETILQKTRNKEIRTFYLLEKIISDYDGLYRIDNKDMKDNKNVVKNNNDEIKDKEENKEYFYFIYRPIDLNEKGNIRSFRHEETQLEEISESLYQEYKKEHGNTVFKIKDLDGKTLPYYCMVLKATDILSAMTKAKQLYHF